MLCKRLSVMCWHVQEGQQGKSVVWTGELPAEAVVPSAADLRRGVPDWMAVFSAAAAAPAEAAEDGAPIQAPARLHPVKAILGGCLGEHPPLLPELDAACRASAANNCLIG